jgi:choline-glycine betaine transporter
MSGKHGKTPRNLCRYFWGIVLPSLVILAAAFEVLFLLWVTFIVNTVATFMVIGVLAFAVLMIVGVVKFIQWRSDRPRAEKGSGPIRAYLHAKKQNVCPMIEVVD